MKGDDTVVIKSEWVNLRGEDQFLREIKTQNEAAQGGFICPIIGFDIRSHPKELYEDEMQEHETFINMLLPKLDFSLEDVQSQFLFLDDVSIHKLVI